MKGEITENKSKNVTNSEKNQDCGYYLKKRYILVSMLALCYLNAYINRSNLSVAIISMTNKKGSNANFYEFNWNEMEKSYILSSLYLGCTIALIPSGILAHKFSPKLLLGAGNLVSSIMVGISPSASYFGGWALLSVLRFLIGLTQGFLPPIAFTMASSWIPPNERNRLLGIIFTGPLLSFILAPPISGLLASSAGGWPSIFYLSAALNLLWTIAWFWLAADTPAEHTTISSEERNFIEASTSSDKTCKTLKIPWRDIFMSSPFLAVLIANFSCGFFNSLETNEIPSFINGILKVDIKTNGLLNAIPMVLMIIGMYPSCSLADYLIRKNYLSKTAVRKIWTTLDLTASAAFLLPLGFLENDLLLVITMLSGSALMRAFIYGSFLFSHLDLAPNFAGILSSLANTVFSVCVMIVPIIVGMIVDNAEDIDKWFIVFLINFMASIIGNLVFLIYGSGDVQYWNSTG